MKPGMLSCHFIFSELKIHLKIGSYYTFTTLFCFGAGFYTVHYSHQFNEALQYVISYMRKALVIAARQQVYCKVLLSRALENSYLNFDVL